MLDLIYIAGTAAFFALMLAYVHVCNRLGRTATVERGHDTSRSEASQS
jgi:hypothetical protein